VAKVTIGLHPRPTAKVFERTKRNFPATNTLVQLLALYIDPDSHNAHRHRQTDGQTDGQTTGMPIADLL